MEGKGGCHPLGTPDGGDGGVARLAAEEQGDGGGGVGVPDGGADGGLHGGPDGGRVQQELGVLRVLLQEAVRGPGGPLLQGGLQRRGAAAEGRAGVISLVDLIFFR